MHLKAHEIFRQSSVLSLQLRQPLPPQPQHLLYAVTVGSDIPLSIRWMQKQGDMALDVEQQDERNVE